MTVWEIEQNFKCPVVGAMLSVDKHKSILKKCGWDVSRMKPYEYHSHLMGCMGDENAVSVKVNNFIRHQARKYMVEIAGLYEKGDGHAVRALWKKYAGQGVIGPVMYAIVAHEDADIELLQDIHGEVHMQAHANMTEVFHIRQKIKSSDETLVREKKKLAEKNAVIREMVSARREENLALSRVRSENARLKKQVEDLEAQSATGPAPDPGEREELERLREALATEKALSQELAREKKQIQIELFSSESENELIRKEIRDLVSALTPVGEESICPVSKSSPDEIVTCPAQGRCTDDTCPNYQLCAKRVFMIGGITKMKSYYRDIVEKAGGEFDYHDGYLKNSNANLAAKVKRCDVVVCPVSCNSHNACLKVKKLCHRYNKELKILNSASLSAVTTALFVQNSPGIN
ncbi:MAG: DUF2325 domain-containing protein [Desulfobacterales bacterium]|nr:DUF2325 domain-containing protein [Desulfobacterales bacterium]